MKAIIANVTLLVLLLTLPLSASATAQLSPVWPPRVGSSASGLSAAMTFSTNSGVTGST